MSLQAGGEFVEGMAGSHHVVHQQYMLIAHGCIRLYRESAAHINPSFTEGQSGLRLGIPNAYTNLNLQSYVSLA